MTKLLFEECGLEKLKFLDLMKIRKKLDNFLSIYGPLFIKLVMLLINKITKLPINFWDNF